MVGCTSTIRAAQRVKKKKKVVLKSLAGDFLSLKERFSRLLVALRGPAYFSRKRKPIGGESQSNLFRRDWLLGIHECHCSNLSESSFCVRLMRPRAEKLK